MYLTILLILTARLTTSCPLQEKYLHFVYDALHAHATAAQSAGSQLGSGAGYDLESWPTPIFPGGKALFMAKRASDNGRRLLDHEQAASPPVQIMLARDYRRRRHDQEKAKALFMAKRASDNGRRLLDHEQGESVIQHLADNMPNTPPHMNTVLAASYIIMWSLLLFISALVMFMMPAEQANQPPVYDPDDRSQSFRAYMTDLMHWCMGTRLAPHEQAVAIVRRLRGTARDMGRTLTPAELFNGGIVNGEQLDPVTYICAGLHRQFAQLDEETRMQAMTEFVAFARNPMRTSPRC